jgi:uncharacterized protein (DUF58 family)
MTDFAAAEVAREAQGRKLALAQKNQRGRLGEVRAASVGSSLELHDFRGYQPGDDLRQVDWNAVARTGEMIIRQRQDEVSPRVDVMLDTSRSMTTTTDKAQRALELTALMSAWAQQAGCEVQTTLLGATCERLAHAQLETALQKANFLGVQSMAHSARALPKMPAHGVRFVISDFLFESDATSLVRGLTRSSHASYFLQVLGEDDLHPNVNPGSQLVDSESQEALERVVSPELIEAYHRRLQAHQQLWRSAVVAARGTLVTLNARFSLATLAREPLRFLWVAA